MGKKNNRAANGYDGRLTLEQFMASFPNLGLSREGYRRIYEHLSDEEVARTVTFRSSGDATDNIFNHWEAPLSRKANATKLPFQVRMSGDPEELQAYLDAHEEELSAADTAFLIRHIELGHSIPEKEHLANLELANTGVRPDKPKLVLDQDDFIRLEIHQPRPQSSAEGCWSVGLQQLIQSRGVKNISQEDIRSYRPAGNSMEQLKDLADDPGMKEADSYYNNDTAVTVQDMLDPVLAHAPNTMVRVMEIGKYNKDVENRNITKEQYRQNAAELIRQTVEKALWIDHSPLVMKEDKHFLNIVGIKDDMLLIQDPLGSKNPPHRMRKMAISEFVEKRLMDEKVVDRLELLWASDISLDKQGKVIGLPDEDIRVSDEGDLQLDDEQKTENANLLPTQKKGFWINRYAGAGDAKKGDQPISKDGLIRTDRVYMPQKLNMAALKSEAEKRSLQMEEKLKNDARLYYEDAMQIKGMNIDIVQRRGLDASKIGVDMKERQEKRRRQKLFQRNSEEEARIQNETEQRKLWNERVEEGKQWVRDLYEIREEAAGLLNEMLLAGASNQSDPTEYLQIIGDLKTLASLTLNNTPKEVMAAVEKVAAGVEIFNGIKDKFGAPESYTDPERQRRVNQVKELVASPQMKERKLMQAGAGESVVANIPIHIQLQEAADQMNRRMTHQEALEAAREADRFAQSVEKVAQKAKASLKVLGGLNKYFGKDSDHYKQMKTQLARVAALGKESTPEAVFRTISDLKRYARDYKIKIDMLGGGNSENGQKRYAEAGRILDLVREWQSGERIEKVPEKDGQPVASSWKLPQNIDLFKSIGEQMKVQETSIKEEASTLGFTYLTEEDEDFRKIPLVKRMSKEEFVEKAQNRGWVFEALGTSDRAWLEELYERAAEDVQNGREDKRRPELLQFIIDENAWEPEDRLAIARYVLAVCEEAALSEEEALQLKYKLSPKLEEPQFLEQCAQNIRDARQAQGKTDGQPRHTAPVPIDQGEDPLFPREVNEKGEWIPWTYEEAAIFFQYMKFSGERTILKKHGLLSKDTMLVIDRGDAPAEITTVRPREAGKEASPEQQWAGMDADGNVYTEIGDLKINGAYANRDALKKGKEALRKIKEEWEKAAENLPKTPEGELVRDMYQVYAFLTDPDAGNLLMAVSTKGYFNAFISRLGDAPKFGGRDDISEERVMKMLTGKDESQKDLPEDLRTGVLQEFRDYYVALQEELQVEYDRQHMALDGWNEEKEQEYIRELRKAHQDMILAMQHFSEVKNVGQYDFAMDNTLDDHQAKSIQKQRDCRSQIGNLKGELQAMDMGWKSNELETLGMVGHLEAMMEKVRDGLVASHNTTQAQWGAMETFWQEFHELKARVWNMKVETKEDKLKVFDMVSDYIQQIRNFPGLIHPIEISGLVDPDKTLKRIETTLNGGPRPEITEAEKTRRQGIIAANIEKRNRILEARRAEDEKRDEQIRQEVKSWEDKAEQKGWGGEYKEFIGSVVKTREAIKLAMEADQKAAEKAGREPDPAQEKRRKEAIAEIDDFLKQMASEDLYTPEECMERAKDYMARIRKYQGDVNSLFFYEKNFFLLEDKKKLTEAETNYYDKRAKLAPNMDSAAMQEYISGLDFLTRVMAPATELHTEMESLTMEMMEEAAMQGMNVDEKQSIKPSGRGKLYQSMKKAQDLLQRFEKEYDLKDHPIAQATLERMKLLEESFKGHTGFNTVADKVAKTGAMCNACVQDLRWPDPASLEGKEPAEQKQIIQAFEKAAAKDKDFFEMIREGNVQLRLGLEYSEAKYRAEQAGEAFDDTEYRKKLRESIVKLEKLSKEILDMVKSPDFQLKDHPEIDKKSVENILESRGVQGAYDMCTTQLALIDAGIPLDEVTDIYQDHKLFYSEWKNLENCKKNGGVIHPVIGDIEKEMQNLEKLGTAEEIRRQAQKGENIRENISQVVRRVMNIVKEDKPELNPEEQHFVKNIKGACQKYMKEQGKILCQKLQMIQEEPGKLVDSLLQFGADKEDPFRQYGLGLFQKELFKEDWVKLSGKGPGRIYSHEKISTIRGILKELGERQLDKAWRLSQAMKEDPASVERLRNELADLADLEEGYVGQLKKFTGKIDNMEVKDFLEQVHFEAYEAKRNELVLNMPEDPELDTTQKRVDQVHAQLSVGLQELNHSHLADYKHLIASEQEIRAYEAAENEKQNGLNTYETNLTQIRNKAAELLRDLESDGYAEEKNSRWYKDMRDALREVSRLDDKKTPEQILEAVHRMQDMAQAYHDKRDNLPRFMKSTEGLRRLDLSEAIVRAGTVGVTGLDPNRGEGAGVVDEAPEDASLKTVRMNKTLAEQKTELKKTQDTYQKEKDRRRVSLQKLMEEENKLKGGEKKKRHPERKAPGRSNSLSKTSSKIK